MIVPSPAMLLEVNVSKQPGKGTSRRCNEGNFAEIPGIQAKVHL